MRDWLTKDFGWKIFSLILAFGIWITVRNISEETGAPGLLSVQNVYTNVPVVAVSATADVRHAQIAPQSVSVTVSGAPDVMAALQTGQIHAVINLTGIDSAHNLPRHVDVAAPPRITLLNVDPPSVTVTIPEQK